MTISIWTHKFPMRLSEHQRSLIPGTAVMEITVALPPDHGEMSWPSIGCCAKLKLADRSDLVTELIASKIIEIARSGERSATAICDRALEELGVSPKQPT